MKSVSQNGGIPAGIEENAEDEPDPHEKSSPAHPALGEIVRGELRTNGNQGTTDGEVRLLCY